MSDSTFQCILPLVILAIVWFALFQIKKKSRQTPTQTLTLSTELSRQEIGEIVADALPRSLISSAFNWNMHAIRDELKISGNYLTDGQGCLVLLVTGIIPGFLLLIFTADEIELITMDFSFLEDSGLLKVTTEGPRAQQVTEKLIPKLEHKQRHFQWDEAVIAATTTKGDQIKLLSMKSHNDGQEDSDLQSNADKEIQAKMHREQAHGYLQKGDFLEAFHEGQKAIQLLPNSAEAHNELGVILDGLGRQTEAIAAYELALSLDPALTDARKNLEEASQEN